MTEPLAAMPDLPQKGDCLAGKYLVEEVLGAGGMGVVVAARHMALRQRVAVKFLLPAALRMPEARARLLREAQAAVAIQSEHAARVLDVGTLGSGAPFMVMEYLSRDDGAPLAHASRHRGQRGAEARRARPRLRDAGRAARRAPSTLRAPRRARARRRRGQVTLGHVQP